MNLTRIQKNAFIFSFLFIFSGAGAKISGTLIFVILAPNSRYTLDILDN